MNARRQPRAFRYVPSPTQLPRPLDERARMVIKAESSGLSFYEKLSRSDSIKGYPIDTHKIAILKAYSLQKSLNLCTPLLSRRELAETHIIRTRASPQKHATNASKRSKNATGRAGGAPQPQRPATAALLRPLSWDT